MLLGEGTKLESYPVPEFVTELADSNERNSPLPQPISTISLSDDVVANDQLFRELAMEGLEGR